MATDRDIIELILRARDEVSGPLRALADKIDALDSHVKQLGGKFDELNQKLGKTEQQVKSTEKSVEGLDDTVRSTGEGAAASARKLDVLHRSLEHIDKSGSKAKKTLGDFNEQADLDENIGRKYTQLGSTIERLGFKIKEQQGKIAQARLEGKGLIDDEDKALEDLEDTSARTAQSMQKHIKGLSKELRTMRHELTAATGERASIDRGVFSGNANASEISKVRAQIEKTADAMARLEKNGKGTTHQYDLLLTKIRNLASRSHEMGDEIAGAFASQQIDHARVATEKLNESMGKTARSSTAILANVENIAHQMERANRRGDTAGVDHMRERLAGLRDELQQVGMSADQASSSIERTVNRVREVEHERDRSNKGFFGDSAMAAGITGMSVQAAQIGFVIKYAQALATAAAGAAAQLIALGSAAIEAGAALGGSFVSGIAQAMPVLGILFFAITRVVSVIQALRLSQQNQLNAHHQQTLASNRQAAAHGKEANAARGVANANTAIASAQDAVKAAHENTRRAAENLTRARREAVKNLDDLIDREKDLQLTAEGASLSQEEAQRRLRTSIRDGASAAEVARNQLDVRRANRDVTSVQRDIRVNRVEQQQIRKHQDPGELSAQRGVVDAQRQEANASRQLERSKRQLTGARQQDTQALNQNAAATDRLNAMLAQLSPAERALYRTLQKLYSDYKTIGRQISDILIESFTRSAKKIDGLFHNKELINNLKGLATEMGKSIDRITDRLIGPKGLNFINFIIHEATRNMKPFTSILISLIGIFESIARAASPVFRVILRDIDFFLKRVDKKWDRNNSGLVKFFFDAYDNLRAITRLGLAVMRLFGTLIGASVGSGRKTIEDFTLTVQRATLWLRAHQEQTRGFFRATGGVLKDIGRLVLALGKELLKAFDPGSMHAFTQFMRAAIIPAIGAAVRIMGQLVKFFHEIFGNAILSTISRFAVQLFLLERSFGLIAKVIAGVRSSLAGFSIAFAALLRGTGSMANARVLLLGAASALVIISDKLGDASGAAKALKGAISVLVGVMVARNFASIWGAVTLRVGGAVARLRTFFTMARGAAGPMAALRTALMSSMGPWGILAGAIAAIVTGFLLFGRKQKTMKDQLHDTTKAILSQRRAFRDLFDTVLAGQSLKLDKAEAVIGVRAARRDLQEAEAQAKKKGKLTQEEKDNLASLRIAYQRAKLDLKGVNNEIGKNSEEEGRKGKKALKEHGEAVDKAGTTYRNAKSEVGRLREAQKHWRQELKDSRSETGKTAEGTRRFEMAKANLREVTRKLTTAEGDERTAKKKYITVSQEARSETKRLSGTFGTLSGSVYDSAVQILQLTNKELGKFGVKPLEVDLKRPKGASSPGANSDRGSDNTGESHPDLHFAAGGMIPNSGSLRDDYTLMSPAGTPVAKMAGNEAILNRHQQPIVDASLKETHGFGLPGLFKKIQKPHWMAMGGMLKNFAGGGGVDFDGHPSNVNSGVRRLIQILKGKFPLQVTSTTDHGLTRRGTVSDHQRHAAVDLSGASDVMFKASQYIMTSGLYRKLKQGIHNPNLAVNRGKFVGRGFYAGDWAAHLSHIHLAIAGALAGDYPGGGGSGGFNEIRPLKAQTNQKYAGEVLNKIDNKLRKAANKWMHKKLDPLMAADDIGGMFGFGGIKGGGDAQANMELARKMMLKIWPASEWPALKSLWIGESGFRTHADNPHSDAYGIPQALPGRKMASAGRDWHDNPVTQIKWGLNYIRTRPGYGSPSAALRFKRAHNWYEGGGLLDDQPTMPFVGAFNGGGTVKQDGLAYVHKNEAILNPGQQGVLVTAINSLRRAVDIGVASVVNLRKPTAIGKPEIQKPSVTKAPKHAADDFFLPSTLKTHKGSHLTKFLKDVDDTISDLGNFSPRHKGGPKKWIKNVRRALSDLVDDDGLLTKFSEEFSAFSDRLKAQLQKATFRLTKSGKIIRVKDPDDVVKKELSNIGKEMRFLLDERSDMRQALREANHQLRIANRRHDKKAAQQIRASIKKIRDLLDKLSVDIAAKVQEAGEAQEAALDLAIKDVTDAYDDRTSGVTYKKTTKRGPHGKKITTTKRILGTDLRTRVATARDRLGELDDIDAVAVKNMQTERKGLVKLLHEARNKGNKAKAQELQKTIADLDVSIIETAQKRMQDAIMIVNTRGERREARMNRIATFGELVQSTGNLAMGFANRAGALIGTGVSQRQQLGDLQKLLPTTTGAARFDLQTKIADLKLAILQNTKSLIDLRTEYTQARIDAATSNTGFMTNALGGLSTILSSLNVQPSNPIMKAINAALASQSKSGAKGMIGELFDPRNGFGNVTGALGLSRNSLTALLEDPKKFVEVLLAALKTSNFSNYLNHLQATDPGAYGIFTNLIQTIIDLTGAMVANTQQIQILQSFNSTPWQLFRQAIFDGNNNLLPSYKIPAMDTGGYVKSSGLAMIHGGERVYPASVVRDGKHGGDTHLYVTNPTQVVDPAYLARVFEFRRSTGKAT